MAYLRRMSDIFTDDLFPTNGERDPARAAQEAMRPSLRKRFYEKAGVQESGDGFRLVLDSRPANTPARRPLSLPTRALAEAVAAEWSGQGAEIDPATMPVTRLANTVIDAVAERRSEVVDDLVKFAGSDLVCYRAGEPARLVAEQDRAWNPVLDFAREDLGASFVLAEGVIHQAQPPESLAAIRRAIEAVHSPFRLAALHVMTTLTGSVLIALAHAAGRLDADEAWSAAHVDEFHQESVWGRDEEAHRRRERRRAEFDAASTVHRLSAA
jgi:chaperone required for assembly of F1-ATPase